MNKIIIIVFCYLFVGTNVIFAQESNNWGAKLRKSNFHLGIDLQTKYMWRGMEMMTEEAAPVLFPTMNYQHEGLYLYAMGGYAVNGKYAEVDLGASYTWKEVTIGFNDYYYPSIDSNKDAYLKSGKNTGHWLEATFTYAPEKIPLWATISNFFYGADKYVSEEGKEKRAYSTYMELGTYYDFMDNNRIALAVGAACNRSCYNSYETGFSVCNIELKYTNNVNFKSGLVLPLSVAYIYNPQKDKAFVDFTAGIAF